VCKERKLQYTRACPLLPPDSPKDNSFKYFIKDTVFKECPVGQLDHSILQPAMEAYEFYSSGFLPDTGTVYDQTQFFLMSAQLIKQKYKQLEAEAYQTPAKGA
jgi:hypothetical protein